MTRRAFIRHRGRTKVVPPTPLEVSPEERLRLAREYARTHPPKVNRLSGCCDPPLDFEL